MSIVSQISFSYKQFIVQPTRRIGEDERSGGHPGSRRGALQETGPGFPQDAMMGGRWGRRTCRISGVI